MTIGDVIVGVHERTIGDADDLQRALGSASVGSAVPVRFLRGGSVHDVAVTIGERPHDDD